MAGQSWAVENWRCCGIPRAGTGGLWAADMGVLGHRRGGGWSKGAGQGQSVLVVLSVPWQPVTDGRDTMLLAPAQNNQRVQPLFP